MAPRNWLRVREYDQTKRPTTGFLPIVNHDLLRGFVDGGEKQRRPGKREESKLASLPPKTKVDQNLDFPNFIYNLVS